MENLPSEVLEKFLKGQHVMRHKPGLWNGIWSDMFIESTFMRYGHGPGGVIGVTLQPATLKLWAYSLHICAQITGDIVAMTEGGKNRGIATIHKEVMPARITADRSKLREKLFTCIDPFMGPVCDTDIVNILTGHIAHPSVNVDESVTIGTRQLQLFEQSWPE